MVEDRITLRGDKYSPAYAQKLQDTYRYFRSEGFTFTEHALNESIGRVQQGRLPSMEAILDTLRNGKVYLEAEGSTLRYGNGVSIHFSSETGRVKSVVPRKKPKDSWREPDGGS